MFMWTFLLRITHTIISQSSADSSWITLYIYIHTHTHTHSTILKCVGLQSCCGHPFHSHCFNPSQLALINWGETTWLASLFVCFPPPPLPCKCSHHIYLTKWWWLPLCSITHCAVLFCVIVKYNFLAFYVLLGYFVVYCWNFVSYWNKIHVLC